MNKQNLIASIATASLLACSNFSYADISAEVGVVSDYRENGISWSDRKPALQAGVEYSHDSGFYLGGWASNIDYGEGDDAKVETNFYIGYEYGITEDVLLRGEAMKLIYIGDSNYNYEEYTIGLNLFENTDFSVTYTSDYSGSELANYLFVLSQDFPFADVYNLNVSLFRQQHETPSADKDTYPIWDEDHNYYNGAAMTLSREWQSFDFAITASTTSIKTPVEDGKSSIVFGISKAWDW